MDTAMINKKVILAVLLLSCGLSVSAQKRGGKSASKPKTEKAAETKETKAGDLNREMEVTRAYEPTVSEANKLNVKPNLVDTVKLRPEFSYGITPSPIAYGFEVTPIKAATVDIDLYKRLNPLYAKVALGYPMQSLADVYFNTTGKSKGMFGAYLNHYGSWSKLENGDGIETPASQTFNKIGVLGERRWTRYVLNGEIGVDYDMVIRYGYAIRTGYAAPGLVRYDRFGFAAALLRPSGAKSVSAIRSKTFPTLISGSGWTLPISTTVSTGRRPE